MKKLSLLLLCMLAFSSCTKILLGSFGQKTVDPYLKVLEKEDKTVIFIPVTHVADPEFYASVKRNIDSLRNAGFTIAYEGYRSEPDLSQATKDTLALKGRRILRFQMPNDYLSTEDKSIPKKYKKIKGVSQNQENTGIIYGTDLNFDLSLYEMVLRYEEIKGEIILTDCDFSTPLTEPYRCKAAENRSRYIFSTTIRDEYLVERVLASSNSKIAILYGAGHWYGVYPDLMDAGYTLTHGSPNTYVKSKRAR